MRHLGSQAKAAAEPSWHTGPAAGRFWDAPALPVWGQWGDGSTREEKGPHNHFASDLHLSSTVITIRKHQCPQRPRWLRRGLLS